LRKIFSHEENEVIRAGENFLMMFSITLLELLSKESKVG
jgi:hypothetical protein